ncbi:ROK family protein [Paenibacillus aquistagni]|uniref:ROK family protein n=1 Tax=Paenibacillus aquistagni TaxID=1852522 RepID=UPI000B512FB4|nr:ROK family protein [Paenibacillus aquistagni]
MNPYVGVDIGVSKMCIVAEADEGFLEQQVAIDASTSVEELNANIAAFLTQHQLEPNGIGIGVMGLVEGDERISFSDMAVLNGVRAEQLGNGCCPVKLINDVKAATIAEARHYPNHRAVLFVLADAGIAAGIVVDGKLLQGASGWSGELGYTMVPVSGRVKKLDDLAGGAAILREAGVSREVLLRKLDRHDPKASGIIQQAGFYFGLALTNLIHLYNPDVIIVGGRTAEYPGYLERSVMIAAQYTLQDLFQACRIETALERHLSVAVGACEYVKQQLALVQG